MPGPISKDHAEWNKYSYLHRCLPGNHYPRNRHSIKMKEWHFANVCQCKNIGMFHLQGLKKVLLHEFGKRFPVTFSMIMASNTKLVLQ